MRLSRKNNKVSIRYRTSGLICMHSHEHGHYTVFLSNLEDPIATEFSFISRHNVDVTYWISNDNLSFSDVQEQYVLHLLGKSAQSTYMPIFSSYTGYMYTDDSLKIGGHDLVSELKSYVGKWINLEIVVHYVYGDWVYARPIVGFDSEVIESNVKSIPVGIIE